MASRALPLLTASRASSPGEGLAARVHLARVLAAGRSPADRHGRAVGLGHELLPERPLSPSGPPTSKAPAPLTSQSTLGSERLELPTVHVLAGNRVARRPRLAREGDPVDARGVLDRQGHADERTPPHDHERLAVRAEAQVRPLDAEPLERGREVGGERLLEGTVAGAPAPHRVADADRLVVAHVADRALVLGQRAEAEIGPHLELPRLGPEDAGGRPPVARVGERLPDEGHDFALLDGGRLPPRGDAAVHEDDVPVERDLDADEGVRVARGGERDDALGDGVGQPVGVPRADGLGESQRLAHAVLLRRRVPPRQLFDANGEGLEVPPPALRGQEDADLEPATLAPPGRAPAGTGRRSRRSRTRSAAGAAGERVLEDAHDVGAAGRRALALEKRVRAAPSRRASRRGGRRARRAAAATRARA